MKKKEILKNYQIIKLNNKTVFIHSKDFYFSFTSNLSLKNIETKYNYFGGLQCNFYPDSKEYKQLEKWLCKIAEILLKISN